MKARPEPKHDEVGENQMKLKAVTMIALVASYAAASALPVQAATINAASCSLANVTSAVAAAVAGDTVMIPAGTCSWSTTLTVNKAITMLGAGQGVTVLQDNVSKGGGSCTGGGPLMDWTVNSTSAMRISALTIQGIATDPGVCQQGHVSVGGKSKSMRIDHITVNPATTVAIIISGDVWGVVDHLTFSANFKNAVRVEHVNWNGTSGDTWGDQSWAQALQVGSGQGIVIEDSTFTDTSGGATVGNFTDCFSGGRMTIRHNSFNAGNLTSHGADSDQRHRACRWQEIYNNTFTFTSSQGVAFVTWIRGGSGVVFNNTISAPGGLNQLVQASNCRDASAGCGGGPNYTPWGACNGSSSYDQNTSNGYRCVDQPGSGTSNLLSGSPPPAAWVGNAVEPIYVWNNTVNGASKNTISGSTNVSSARDYMPGTARPGYASYTYPHPLATGSGGTNPSAPTNLRVSGT